MTLVYRPIPIVRFMHTSEQPLKSNWCMAWHDLEHGRVFTHGPAPWNPAKNDSVENVHKNYVDILMYGRKNGHDGLPHGSVAFMPRMNTGACTLSW